MAVQSQFYSDNYQDWIFHPLSTSDNLLFNPQLTQFHDFPRLVSSPSSSLNTFSNSMALSHSLNSELQFQNQETDFLLRLQNEKLRNALHEQTKQQLTSVLSNMERKASNMMKQKEVELAQATRKATELQERLKKAEMEKEAWKRVANAKEATAINLSNKLEQAKSEQRQRFLALTNAESSRCGSCDEEEEEEEEKQGRRNNNRIVGCKRCNNKNPCVVLFLPCKHVCSCKYCEAVLGYCPVCNSVKEASMEVLFV